MVEKLLFQIIEMMQKYVLLSLVLVVALGSCVPTKKITYLQYGKDMKSETPKDTVVRNYELKTDTYRLQANDIISLRVASVTDEEFNFIKRYETDLGNYRKLNQYSQGFNRGNNQNNRGGNNFGFNAGAGNNQGNISSLALDNQNTGFSIDLNGEMELPDVGKIKLAGLTIPEAELLVKERLQGYYETPMVRIQLLNWHFNIVGEVENEGRYTSFDPEITIFDAILIAGNLGEYANRNNIKIIRNKEGEAKVLYVNLLDETTLNAENYYIQRGDMIIVDALEARTSNTYTWTNIGRTLGIVSAALAATALVISLSR